MVEQFYDSTESVDFGRYDRIGVVDQPEPDDDKCVFSAIDQIERIKRGDEWRKQDVIYAIRIAVPELEHREKHRNLDQGM